MIDVNTMPKVCYLKIKSVILNTYKKKATHLFHLVGFLIDVSTGLRSVI